MSASWSRQRVLEEFGAWRSAQPEHARALDAQSQAYVSYHAGRYARLLSAVEEVAAASASEVAAASGSRVAATSGSEIDAASGPGGSWQILDIGPNVQTALLRTAYPGAIVDTLGFDHPAVPSRKGEQHVRFDLNQSLDRDLWPALERHYDVVILAEVLEHLYTPPHIVLDRVRGLLRPSGRILVQTPNAAALHKRLTLLVGRNPVEPPRASRENPGHLHEYTLRELRAELRACDLTLDWLRAENYFGSGAMAGLYRAAGRVMPLTWRHGVTLCARARA